MIDVLANIASARSAEETTGKIDRPADEVSVAMSIMSPFAKTSNKYQWPSLYEEIDEMLEMSVLTCPIVDLRALAKEGKVENDCVSKLPLSSAKCVDAIAANLASFEITKAGVAGSAVESNERFAVRLDALKALHSRQLQAKSEGKPFAVSSANFIAFSDDSTSDELSYAISVDKIRRRVTICFRGSADDTKWATSEAWMKSMRNPSSKRPDQPKEVKVLNKVYDCLFSASKNQVKGPKGMILNEFQSILQKTIIMALKRNPGFKLYVTGHSFGAAIATLFAFESAAASENIIPKPVTCVSIGGPYVGDSNFREAHQWLERQGKLRHIRVSNHQDLVTTVPVLSFNPDLFEAQESNIGTPFKHVGMNIRLFDSKEAEEGSYEIAYPKVSDSLLQGLQDEIERGIRNSFLANLSDSSEDYWSWPWHGKCAYNDRINKNKASLEKIRLDALYKDDSLVGDLVGQI